MGDHASTPLPHQSETPLSDSLLTRREAIAALAYSTTLPLMSACTREPSTASSTAASTEHRGRRARAAGRHRQRPASAGARDRDVARHRHRRESGASFAAHGSLGGGTAADREPAAARSGAGQRVRRLRPPACDAHQHRGRAQRLRHGARGLRAAVRRRHRRRLAQHAVRRHPERRRLSRRPAVPRQRASNRARRGRRGVSGAAAVLREAARRRARPHAGGARGGPRAAGVPDRQGAGADDVSRSKNAREGGTLVESIERRTKNIPGNWAERARGDRGEGDRAGARAAIGGTAGAARRRDRRRRASGRGRTARSSTGGRSRRRPPPRMSPDEVHEMGQRELQRPARADGRDPERASATRRAASASG